MTVTAIRPDRRPSLADEHDVLLWQTCSYADDLIEAARSGRSATGAYDAMLEFAHYRLLPYLTDEERRLPAAELRDDHLTSLLRDDHARIRHGVDSLESCRTRQLLALAAEGLIERLERHTRREETWIISDPAITDHSRSAKWALPLVLSAEINLDALPADARDRLVLQRLGWMRCGETLRLESSCDLHPLWLLDHRREPHRHAWVYEQDGPTKWRARITRHAEDD